MVEQLTFRAPVLGFALVLMVGLAGCETAPSAPPKSVNVYVDAVQDYKAGRKKEAEQKLVQATKANPDLRMAHSMLGDIYRNDGRLEQARDEYEITVRLDPYGWDNHYRLGLTYQLLKELKKAAASYLRALKLNPSDPNTNMNLGTVYLSLEQYDDAVRYLERASALAPNSVEAWANLGVALDARGNHVLAEASYRKALELDSRNVATMLNLGSSLLSQGKSSEAVVVFETALSRSDSPAIRKRYADALGLARRYEEAMIQYDLVLKQDPRYYPAMNEKGLMLVALYQRDLELDDTKLKSAVDLWKQSLAVNPNQPRVQQHVKQWEKKKLFGE